MPLLTPNYSSKTQVFHRQQALDYSSHSFKTSILQAACPCLPPATVLGHKYSTGSMPLLTPNYSSKTQVFHRQHALDYSSHSFKTSILQAACPCLPPATVLRHTYSTGSMPLLTLNYSSKTQVFHRQHALDYSSHSFKTSILQAACPCLPPATVLGHKYSTGSMPLLTPNYSSKTQVFHRQHALDYSSHSFKTSILQAACPCLPPATVLGHKCSTVSMPLLTPNYSSKTHVFYRQHALDYSSHSFKTSILQAACPCLLPTTVLRHKYSTGSMPLLTPNYSSKTQVFYRQHALDFSSHSF